MVLPSFSVEGKAAIVTGARRGLGKAIALCFAESGADVAVCDWVTEGGELDAVALAIQDLGRRSLVVQTDVTSKSDVEALVRLVREEFGRIDILVNSAGLLGSGPLLEQSEEAWDAILDTNLKGSFLCAQAVSQVMIEQGGGCILNMASVAGFRGGSVYSVSKAGVVMLTGSFARQLDRHNVRVNAIAPNVIRTEKEPERTMSAAFWTDQEAVEQAGTMTPMGRIGDTDDIVGPALFLASDAARYVTGHTLVVDGGLLA